MKPSSAIVLTMGAALLWIGLRFFERAMVFHPSRDMRTHPGAVGLAYSPMFLTASDGVRLRAWWIPGSSPEALFMLCFHGNGGNLSSRVDKMRLFHDAGAAQLWIDFRGYGESGGSPDEPGLYRDALAAWAWASSVKAVAPAKLVLYGESLGNGPAIELASRIPAAGLIVDSGFTSIPDMGKIVLPWFPVRLAKIRFDNLSRLPRVLLPTLFLHSDDDDIIPFEMARRNFLASGSVKKTLFHMKGSHNEGFLETGPAYPKAIKDFLSALAPVEK